MSLTHTHTHIHTHTHTHTDWERHGAFTSATAASARVHPELGGLCICAMQPVTGGRRGQSGGCRLRVTLLFFFSFRAEPQFFTLFLPPPLEIHRITKQHGKRYSQRLNANPLKQVEPLPLGAHWHTLTHTGRGTWPAPYLPPFSRNRTLYPQTYVFPEHRRRCYTSTSSGAKNK